MTDSLILAGGKSTRFRSDKALENFNDSAIPNVEYTANLTLPFVNNCYVSANYKNFKTINNLFNDSKVTVINDQEPLIDCGPLSALWAYFQQTNQTKADLMIIATDYIIDQRAVQFLAEESGYIKIKSLPYYTCCRLKINISLVKQHITEHNYRWRNLLQDAGCLGRDYDGKLKNINYPEDLK
ncbi:molybdenum cofactor guanylyltransferase [Companilactobacillus insicii]|uniref:molybdenum cofactor guanylyltransferase n=1 Tax=Companilactobacillus insicii TaxID=1732567 RepID=UPI000F773CE8|nr:NTP transferase domain-containing protein [Companilactobacillus insicii]